MAQLADKAEIHQVTTRTYCLLYGLRSTL